jgi:formate-dependent nitrite reductase membrane component NrfD
MDLDRPDRFLNVLLRPQWNSWLVKGGYIITVFGLLVTVWLVMTLFDIQTGITLLIWGTAVFAVLLAIYTAFLFAQAKGRDFWQSPSLPLHMLVHSLMAGAGIFMIVSMIIGLNDWISLLKNIMIVSLIINLLSVITELTITHPTTSAKAVVKMITKGRYRTLFWWGTILIGNIIPLIVLFMTQNEILMGLSGLLVLIGIILTEKIWVEAPQRIPLA